jgi:hypothetical protein
MHADGGQELGGLTEAPRGTGGGRQAMGGAGKGAKKMKKKPEGDPEVTDTEEGPDEDGTQREAAWRGGKEGGGQDDEQEEKEEEEEEEEEEGREDTEEEKRARKAVRARKADPRNLELDTDDEDELVEKLSAEVRGGTMHPRAARPVPKFPPTPEVVRPTWARGEGAVEGHGLSAHARQSRTRQCPTRHPLHVPIHAQYMWSLTEDSAYMQTLCEEGGGQLKVEDAALLKKTQALINHTVRVRDRSMCLPHHS